VNEIRVATNQSGTLEVFALGSDNQVYSDTQQSPGGTWGGWGPISQPGPGVTVDTIAVAQNQNGRLEVFGFDWSDGPNDKIYSDTQQTPGGSWLGWGFLSSF
jgi:hypothetical protein